MISVRRAIFSLAALGPLLVFPAAADTVVDVSGQWKLHQSSAAALAPPAVSPAPAAAAPPVTPPPPDPCECDPLSTPEKLEQSTYAFTGRVMEVVRPKKKEARRRIVFESDEIFKGTVPPEIEVLSEDAGNACDLAYEPGQSYLVYARWEWGHVITARCMGTKQLEKAATQALGPSEAAKEKLYVRLRNACMGRLDTKCCLASLKAMQSGYYVPEPQGGCQDGMVPDRLRCVGSYTWCVPPADTTHQ